MSYFEYTKKDLADAKRELAELFCALADDTARKLDDETTDRQLLLEDLLTRIAELADAEGRDVARGFGNLYAGTRPVCAYPLLDAEPTRKVVEPGLSAMNAREFHNAKTFDGVPRHPFEAGYTGMSCDRMVSRNGYGENCGKSFDDPIHDWQW